MDNWRFQRDMIKKEFYNENYCVHIPWHMIHKTIQQQFLMYMYKVEQDNMRWQSNKTIGKNWDKYMTMFFEKRGVPKYQFFSFLEKKYPKYNTECLAKNFDYSTNIINHDEYAICAAIEGI
jgi:hypothetical protein